MTYYLSSNGSAETADVGGYSAKPSLPEREVLHDMSSTARKNNVASGSEQPPTAHRPTVTTKPAVARQAAANFKAAAPELRHLLAEAERTCRAGYPVLRIKRNSKRPATTAGKNDATDDYERLRKLIKPGDNIGVAWPAGVLGIDVDVPKDSDREPLPGAREHADGVAAALEERFSELRVAPKQRTRSEGLLYIVALPVGTTMPSTVDAVPGIDLRGDGRTYTVVEPSVINGNTYEWERPLVPRDQLPVASHELRDYLSRGTTASAGTPKPSDPAAGGAGALRTIKGDPASFAQGLLRNTHTRLSRAQHGRNSACYDEALTLGRWVGGYQYASLPGLRVENAVAMLVDAMKLNGDYEDDPGKAEGTIRSGLRNGMATAYSVRVTSSDTASPLPLTEGDPVLYDADVAADELIDATPGAEDAGILPPMTPELAAKLAAFKDTDLGNAERLAYLFGDRVRYVTHVGWHTYDGRRWRRDDSGGQVHGYAALMVRMMYAAAAEIREEGRRADLARHALRSERGRALDVAVDRLVRGQQLRQLEICADDLDSNADLLNVMNGTIHLPTGHLREHDPGDLITKLAPVEHDPNATAPTWEAFLRAIAGGDDDLVEYKRRAYGCTITGSTAAQAFFIAYGSGANGKTTELETIAAAVGDHATATSYETFASRDGKVKRFGLARLAGARFVRASEGEQGARLAEGTVKLVTGGEKVPAEFKGRDEFEYTPRFTLWLVTNHRPETRGTDRGLWRRVKLVPYPVTIPEAEQDRDLPTKLRTELPGILTWLVHGARDWYAHGLRDCQAVTDATEQYRADNDPLADFLATSVDLEAGAAAKEGSARLYAAYVGFCRENHDAHMTQKTFTARMLERGSVKRKTAKGIVWDGLALTSEGGRLADKELTPPGFETGGV